MARGNRRQIISAALAAANFVLAGSSGDPPTNTVAPSISGTVKVGQTLTCDPGTWANDDPSVPTYSYQWKADGVAISGATNSTFVLTNTQHGAAITCTVTATDVDGSTDATTSATSAVVYADPVNTAAPSITGTAQVGQTLSCSTGTWSGSSITYSYQWKAGGTNISGATSSTFVPTNAEHGATITCTVTATNDGGNASATSSATAACVYAAPTNSAIPTISGTATEGQTLTAGNGTWAGSGIAYSYQWKRGGTNISGATASTYVLQSADVGSTITVTVTATNDGGNANATSSATATVAADYLLDTLSQQPNAAYSVSRKLKSSYSGSCLKVRRSSDSTTQDIGFDSSGLMDTAALLSFCGAGDGFIDTLYDQSGNARNLTQSTAESQPKIVSSGVVNTGINSKPTALFDGTNDHFLTGLSLSNFISASAYGSMSIARPTAGGTGSADYQNHALWCDISGYFYETFKTTPDFRAGHYTSAAKTVTVSSSAYPYTGIFTHRFDGTTIKASIGGGTEGTTTPGGNVGVTVSTTRFGISYPTPSAKYFSGEFAETIIENVNMSAADMNKIGSSWNARYGAAWSNVS